MLTHVTDDKVPLFGDVAVLVCRKFVISDCLGGLNHSNSERAVQV